MGLMVGKMRDCTLGYPTELEEKKQDPSLFGGG